MSCIHAEHSAHYDRPSETIESSCKHTNISELGKREFREEMKRERGARGAEEGMTPVNRGETRPGIAYGIVK